MFSFDLIKIAVSDKKFFMHFLIGSCSDDHLGLPFGTKIVNIVEDYPRNFQDKFLFKWFMQNTDAK